MSQSEAIFEYNSLYKHSTVDLSFTATVQAPRFSFNFLYLALDYFIFIANFSKYLRFMTERISIFT